MKPLGMPKWAETTDIALPWTAPCDAWLTTAGSGAHGQLYTVYIDGTAVTTGGSERNQRCWGLTQIPVKKGQAVTGMNTHEYIRYAPMTDETSEVLFSTLQVQFAIKY